MVAERKRLRANPIGIVVTALTLLAAGLIIAYKKSDTFRAIVDTLGGVLRNIASGALAAVKVGLDFIADGFRAAAAAGRWMWNNVLQPVFSFFVTAIGKVMMTFFGKMLQTIGKVPKMGWVGDLGDKLVNTGKDAEGLGNAITKIPNEKKVTVKVNDSEARATFSWLADLARNPFTIFADVKTLAGRATSPGTPGARTRGEVASHGWARMVLNSST